VKHVEARLLVQFWQLAERWGHVDRDGIAVSSPLTHELLATLVGAARPSVTTALGRLAERGLLLRSGDVRRLSGESRGVVMSAF
jgi:CRP/FNR family transcriptional regulator, cyclic AMP receptor protein